MGCIWPGCHSFESVILEKLIKIKYYGYIKNSNTEGKTIIHYTENIIQRAKHIDYNWKNSDRYKFCNIDDWLKSLVNYEIIIINSSTYNAAVGCLHYVN